MANDPDGFDSRIPVAQRQGSMTAVKKSGNYFVTVRGCRGLQGGEDRCAARDAAASGMGALRAIQPGMQKIFHG
jgi:hypothetical protein